MDLETILLILAVLGTILFLVALVMSYKSWRWHTMLLVGLVFTAGAVATWLSSELLEEHQKWRGILFLDDLGDPDDPKLSIQFGGPAGLIEKTEKLREENYELEFGKENDRGQIIAPGIVQLQSQLASILLDRGRIWSGAQALSLSAEDVLVVEVPQTETYRIEKNIPLYIFSEKTPLEGGEYLGMFRVEEVVGNVTDEEGDSTPGGKVQVTLRPGWPISKDERNRLSTSVNNRDPWRLYDKTPVDRHQVFSELKSSDMKIEEEEFNRLDMEARLRKLLPPRSVQEYIDDYQPAQDQQIENTPERIEELVEFIEDYPDDDTDPYFSAGQQLWLPQVGAEGVVEIRDSVTGGTIEVEAIPSISELLEQEVIERLDEEGSPRYSRKLRDYAYLFRDLYRERQRQSYEIEEKLVEMKTVGRVIDEKQEIVDRFTKEKDRLTNDSEQFHRDEKIIQALTDSMAAQRKSVSTALRKVRQETISLGEELNTKQLKAVREIDRRSPDPGPPAGAG